MALRPAQAELLQAGWRTLSVGVPSGPVGRAAPSRVPMGQGFDPERLDLELAEGLRGADTLAGEPAILLGILHAR